MSKSELHDWECEIEELSGNNVDKMLKIAQDIYNTAFVRGKNHMTWEQEPCEDTISRKAVFETIDDCNSDGLKGIFCSYGDGERFKEYIKELPSVISKGVTVTDFADKCRECGKQKKGKWKRHIVDNGFNADWKCTECGYKVKTEFVYFNYCPNCGIEMEGEE